MNVKHVMPFGTRREFSKFIFSLLASGFFASFCYGMFLTGDSYAAFLVGLEGGVFAILLVPVFLVLYTLKLNGFWGVVLTGAISVFLIFLFNTLDYCKAGVTANLGKGYVCVSGEITDLGWSNVFGIAAEGFLLGLFGAVLFWLMAPKVDVQRRS